MKTLEQITRLIREGRHLAALGAFEPLIADGRTRPEAIGHRGWLLRSLGRLEEAAADFEQLVRDQPGNGEARALLADTLRLAGQAERATEVAVEALALDPMNIQATQVLLLCQRQRGLSPKKSDFSPLPPPEPPAPSSSLNCVLDLIEADTQPLCASVSPGLGRLLYGLVRALKPKLIVETGAFIGYSALSIAQGLKDNGLGHLHSFDLFLDIPGYVSPVAGPCSDTLRACRLHAQAADLADQVTFHKGDSATRILELFEKSEAVIDMAFIDGDHRIRGCLRDWHAIDRFLKQDGIVVLHDTAPAGCGWLGPRYLMEELGIRAPEDYRWVNLPAADGLGLGIIQKRSAAPSHPWRPTLGDLVNERLFNRRIDWKKLRPL